MEGYSIPVCGLPAQAAEAKAEGAAEEHVQLSQQFNQRLNKVNSGPEAIESPDPPLRALIKPRRAGM
jgi:hypothetical protein